MTGDQFNKRKIKISKANIEHSHIYITEARDLLPRDAFGGPTKDQESAKKISVEFSPGLTVETDIPKNRNFFRNRAGVRDFFDRASIEENDQVLLEKLSDHRFRISRAN